MADSDSDDRTEAPSPKRREEAAKRGQVLGSRDATGFAGLAVGLAVLAGATAVLPALIAHWARGLILLPGEGLDGLMLIRLKAATQDVAVASVLVALPVGLAALAVQAGLGGLRFSGQKIGFDPARLDPMAGLGRIFSVRGLLELVKAVVKVALLGAIAWAALRAELPGLRAAAVPGPAGLAWALLGALGRVMLRLVLGLGALAALDIALQYRSLMQGLRMSRQELRDEHKEAEGSPEVKGRIRRQQMQAARSGARRRAALDHVGEATAIITNPTHFAVALRYIPPGMPAPVVIALGRGPMAADILRRAGRAGIGRVESPVLARALYFTGEVGEPIHEALYAAVATVLAHLYRLERGEAAEIPDIAVPPDLTLDEFGRKMETPDVPHPPPRL